MRARWDRARIEGERRQQMRETGFGSNTIDPEHPAHENIVGACAELAFAEYFGLLPPQFYPQWRADPGYEFDTPIGRIDVKAAKKPPWFLGVTDTNLGKHPGADFYALMFCPLDEPECYLVGFATRAEMEAGTHADHMLDPRGMYEPAGRPRPGRWVPVHAENGAGPLHQGSALIAALTASFADLWGCARCGACEFADEAPTCCGARMEGSVVSGNQARCGVGR
jgi:hypothetical protein